MPNKKVLMIKSSKTKDRKVATGIRNHYDDLFAKQNRQQMLDNYHEIINRDCYGIKKEVKNREVVSE